MENPFTHNRATNLIGQVLDQDAADAEYEKTCDHKGTDCRMSFGSLEYRIMMMLFNTGCLTKHALETVGLEGRGDPKPRKLFTPEQAEKITTALNEAIEALSCPACEKDERREWTEPEEHTCKINPFLTCQQCGVRDKSVATTNDPYAREINDEDVEVTLCHECYAERVADV